MKIYISENIDKAISGFSSIPIVYGEIDLSGVPDNGASTVVAIDAVDSISSEKIQIFINAICSKTRLNGMIYLGGLDAYALSRDLLSGNINIDSFNTMIKDKKGIYSSKYLIKLLQDNNIDIQSVVYKGNNYEISGQRRYNKN